MEGSSTILPINENTNTISLLFQSIEKKVMYGKAKEDVREIINALLRYKNINIMSGAVCIDQVHLSVVIPPKISVSEHGILKGK